MMNKTVRKVTKYPNPDHTAHTLDKQFSRRLLGQRQGCPGEAQAHRDLVHMKSEEKGMMQFHEEREML